MNLASTLARLETGEFDAVFDEFVRKRLVQEAETAARAKAAQVAAAAQARRRALELDMEEHLTALAETGAGDAALEARARAELPPEDYAAYQANQAAAGERYATRREYAFMTDAEIETDLEAYAPGGGPRDTDERDETRAIRREVAGEVFAARAEDPAGWAMRDESVKQAIEDAEAALEAAEPGTSEMAVAEREYRRALAARDALQRDMGIAQPRLLSEVEREEIAGELAQAAPAERLATISALRARYGRHYEALTTELSGRVSADTAVLLAHAGDLLLAGTMARGMALDGVEYRGARELTLPMIDGKLDKSRLEDGQLYSFMAGDRIVRVIYDRRTDALVPALAEQRTDPADSVSPTPPIPLGKPSPPPETGVNSTDDKLDEHGKPVTVDLDRESPGRHVPGIGRPKSLLEAYDRANDGESLEDMGIDPVYRPDGERPVDDFAARVEQYIAASAEDRDSMRREVSFEAALYEYQVARDDYQDYLDGLDKRPDPHGSAHDETVRKGQAAVNARRRDAREALVRELGERESWLEESGNYTELKVERLRNEANKLEKLVAPQYGDTGSIDDLPPEQQAIGRQIGEMRKKADWLENNVRAWRQQTETDLADKEYDYREATGDRDPLEHDPEMTARKAEWYAGVEESILLADPNLPQTIRSPKARAEFEDTVSDIARARALLVQSLKERARAESSHDSGTRDFRLRRVEQRVALYKQRIAELRSEALDILELYAAPPEYGAKINIETIGVGGFPAPVPPEDSELRAAREAEIAKNAERIRSGIRDHLDGSREELSRYLDGEGFFMHDQAWQIVEIHDTLWMAEKMGRDVPAEDLRAELDKQIDELAEAAAHYNSPGFQAVKKEVESGGGASFLKGWTRGRYGDDMESAVAALRSATSERKKLEELISLSEGTDPFSANIMREHVRTVMVDELTAIAALGESMRGHSRNPPSPALVGYREAMARSEFNAAANFAMVDGGLLSEEIGESIGENPAAFAAGLGLSVFAAMFLPSTLLVTLAVEVGGAAIDTVALAHQRFAKTFATEFRQLGGDEIKDMARLRELWNDDKNRARIERAANAAMKDGLLQDFFNQLRNNIAATAATGGIKTRTKLESTFKAFGEKLAGTAISEATDTAGSAVTGGEPR